ncbi:hypothetical protein GCM10023168_25670 [Fodinibacter luteus]|uniref:Uncharacterized protein n=1 Tax=Fodinibacter luteus TaxID=552064 RepID=A0ABP8KK96_9MICO
MSTSSTLGRRVLVGTAAAAALVMGAAPAMAHHCFIPMYSLNAPTSSNWLVFSAEDGAGFGGYAAECEGAAEAGYDALRAAGMPVGIKIFEKMTIGDPKHTGRMNPNGANGVGLEYFEAGSGLPDEMVETWIEGAEGYAC